MRCGGLGEAAVVEDVRPDVAVQAAQLERRLGEHRGDGLGRGAAVQAEAELAVLLAGGDVLVGVGLDARRDPQVDRLPHAGARRRRRRAGRARRRSRRRRARRRPGPPAPARRPTCCCRGTAAVRREAGAQRDGELAAGADVEPQPLLGHPARDRGAQERLGGVVDVAAREGVAPGPAAGAEVGLVEHVRRGAELGRERPHVDAAELEDAVVGAAGAAPARPGGRGRPRPAPGGWADRAAAARCGGRCSARPCVRHAPQCSRSHALRGADAEEREAVLEHRAGGAPQQQPRRGLGRRLLVALGQHLAVVPEALRRLGDLLLQVARDPVRLAQLGGRRDDRRELGQRQQELGLARVREQREVDVVDATGSARPSVARRCAAPRPPAWRRTGRRRPGCRRSCGTTGRGRCRSCCRCWSAPARSGRRRRRPPRRGPPA